MMKMSAFVVIAAMLGSNAAIAQTAQQVLKETDKAQSTASDQSYLMKMTLIDKSGKSSVREAKMAQKGDNMRMMRFLSPGDVKGVSILTLPNDVIYFFMPAFNKTRRIAAHVKNQSFMGTDFSYDDFGSIKFEEDYETVSLKDDGDSFILECKPKENSDKEYSKVIMRVNKNNYYREKTNYFDKAGTLIKVMEQTDIRKVGKYWVSHKVSMIDIKKSHSTIMELQNIEFDTGLKDEFFSERYLGRDW